MQVTWATPAHLLPGQQLCGTVLSAESGGCAWCQKGPSPVHGEEGREEGKSEGRERRETLGAYPEKALSLPAPQQNPAIGTLFLFPASIPPKKTGFLLLTQEERMLYKQRHLEPKCLELLPTQTTHDLVPDEQIARCLIKSLEVQRVI